MTSTRKSKAKHQAPSYVERPISAGTIAALPTSSWISIGWMRCNGAVPLAAFWQGHVCSAKTSVWEASFFPRKLDTDCRCIIYSTHKTTSTRTPQLAAWQARLGMAPWLQPPARNVALQKPQTPRLKPQVARWGRSYGGNDTAIAHCGGQIRWLTAVSSCLTLTPQNGATLAMGVRRRATTRYSNGRYDGQLLE